MAFDFPAGPTNGQIYTSGGAKFIFNGYAWIGGIDTAAVAPFVLKSGDVMSGHLTLPGAPVQPLHAATKAYVDAITQNLPQGLVGQALVVGVARKAQFGNPIEGGNF